MNKKLYCVQGLVRWGTPNPDFDGDVDFDACYENGTLYQGYTGSGPYEILFDPAKEGRYPTKEEMDRFYE